MDTAMVKTPSVWLPFIMSGTALALVLAHLATYGTARDADEGALAHLWQALMLGQIPIIGWFAIQRVRKSPRHAALVPVLQVVAALAAAAPVAWFRL